MASLVVISGRGKGINFSLPTDRDTVIGRGRSCGLQILDPYMSRKHGVIAPDGEDFVIKDPGSANGVTVNGKQVEEQKLADGDKIRLGMSEMEFYVLDAAPAAADADTEQLPDVDKLLKVAEEVDKEEAREGKRSRFGRRGSRRRRKWSGRPAKSGKSEKPDKSERSDKAEKSDKADKSDGAEKPDKPDKPD
ncbi:MAG: FHA domain-containing protein [Planctomycetota bacterium]|jgi:pSer/pThr/pTyr-binding forkhead associated (FHA) protein